MEILIADDNQIIRYGLKLVLKSVWPEAVLFETENLNEAVNIIIENNIDMVIFDVEMPGNHSLEDLIRFISKDTQVVIFSPYRKDDTRIEGLRLAGATVFLFKDSTIDEMKSVFSSISLEKNKTDFNLL